MFFLYNKIYLPGKRSVLLPVFIWFLFALIAVLAEIFHDSINNYLIFKNVFWHTWEQKNLYLQYPQEYEDSNHYGPFFSLIIAPFALLPNWIGVVLWVMANATFLFYAIKQLPFTDKAINTILLICAIEFMTSSHNVQFNPMMVAWIILSYTFVNKEKELWATFFIAAGFLVKLYGIVGVLFFVFSKHKPKFIVYLLVWLVVLFCLPMVISSPAFILQSYQDWANSLIEKNLQNINLGWVNMQDISVMGIIRRTFRYSELSNLTVIAPAAVLLALPLLRFKLYDNKVFQIYYLALALITTVIYSSSAESATYIIAMVGVAIWYVCNMHKRSAVNNALLIFALFVTSLSATDLCPWYIKKQIILAYALKALPCFIIWLILICKVSFEKEHSLQTPAML